MIVALYAWGAKHSAAGSEQVFLTDQDTGDTIIPVWMDKSTGRRISTMNAAFLPGPHADTFIQERLDPAQRTMRRERAQSLDQGAIE